MKITLTALLVLFTLLLSAQTPMQWYGQVQDIYNQYVDADCEKAKNLIEQLQMYEDNGEIFIPESKAYTVAWPNKVEKPTIAQLVSRKLRKSIP